MNKKDILFNSEHILYLTELIPHWLGVIIVFITFIGSVYFILPVTFGTYFLKREKKYHFWPPLILASYAIFSVLKPVIGKERPNISSPVNIEESNIFFRLVYDVGVEFSSASFPSGHAVAAATLATLFIFDYNKLTIREKITISSIYLTIVGFSRVALGVHFIGDILFGFIIGFSFIFLMLQLRDRINYNYFLLTTITIVIALSTMTIAVGRTGQGFHILIALFFFIIIHIFREETTLLFR